MKSPPSPPQNRLNRPSVREAYDRWADTYDSMTNMTRDLDAEQLRADLAAGGLGDVLELGCGTGKNTQWLLEAGRITGLDISPNMIARCRMVAPEATLHIADLNGSWPVEDRAFDMVIASLVLEHIGDLEHIASQTARVLRSKGRLRISELHPWRQHMGKRAYFEDAGERVEPPVAQHTTEEYVTTFLRAGFALESLSEPKSAGDSADRLPRLLVMTFVYR